MSPRRACTRVLAESFVFLPGIGPKSEARLWRRGIRDWESYLARAKGTKREAHGPLLARARDALGEGDARFFGHHLPRAEHWRAWREFGRGALAIDIETSDDGITVVGIHGSRRIVQPQGPHDRDLGATATRLLVRGEDLTPDAVTEALAPATMLLSFNGAAFDVPALEAFGARVPRVPHADLLTPLRRVGLKGGLKKVEAQAGLARPAAVAGLTGFDAILLWRQHQLGDEEALPKLLLYNACDVENLPPLAELAYARLRDALLAPPPEPPLAAFGT